MTRLALCLTPHGEDTVTLGVGLNQNKLSEGIFRSERAAIFASVCHFVPLLLRSRNLISAFSVHGDSCDIE